MPYYIKRKKKKTDSKPKTKSRTDYIAVLDRWFSAYIRLRDALGNGYFVCISCSQIKPFEQADCGHFWSRRHMNTRFDEDNAHAECRSCNRFSADHLAGYQVNLIRKIGTTRFEWLRVKHMATKHWTEAELKERIDYYKKEVKRLSSLKGIRVNP